LSQTETREAALANIREAIQLWLEVAEEDARREAASEVGTLAEVTVRYAEAASCAPACTERCAGESVTSNQPPAESHHHRPCPRNIAKSRQVLVCSGCPSSVARPP
jgi:hypothetical protein